MMTGFSNERTSEYMICNDLYNRIKNKYSFFYPFYYCSKRDDTNLSLLNDISNLHLVACFARRPKTNNPMSSYTYVTFRQSLFEQTNFLNKYGIPVISGTPIGTSIEKIGFGSKCIWFSIYPGNQEEYVVYKFYDGNIEADCTIKDISLVNDDGLYDILSLTPLLKWTEVISLLKAWQMEYKDYFYSNHGRILFNSIPVQRPFFIVYK